MKNSKRILSVTIKRMADTSPDTSYYGEYSNNRTSEFSIDRQHALDCPHNLGTFKEHDETDHECEYLGNNAYSCGYLDNEDCCSGGDMLRNEYRYFNPSFNYVGSNGKIQDSLTPDEVRQYTLQDYQRMESLNNQNWYFIGIAAEAEYHAGSNIVQEVTSGGLWGIESDCDKDELAGVESEQLADLRKELHSIGFSKRAIASAFKNINRKDY